MTDVAIRCAEVWKKYRIYHQRSDSLKERILTRRNSYEEFLALQDVSFEVGTGATLGIIGANGSGKSTLLKVIARILTPDRGVVQSFGTMSSLLELGTGFHPELTGRENVYLAGSLLGQKRAAVDRKYDSIVDFAGIEEFMDLPVKNYSSGMYARLAFAVAISVEPEILLIDEVLSVGDESFQMKCFERIAEFRSQGRTIVLVSHSLDSIRSLCEDAIWLEHGKMRALGKSHDVVGEYLSEVHRGTPHHAAAGARRYGSMEAEIVDVQFEGAGGTAAGATFRTGDPMTIRIRYRTDHAPIPHAAAIVNIHRADNFWHIFGQNTKDTGLEFSLESSGEIVFTVPSLPLLKGTYVVTTVIQNVEGSKVFDCHDRMYSFLVFDNTEVPLEYGAMHIGARWSVTNSPSSVAV